MTNGFASLDAPGLACFDSGNASLSTGSFFFAVVVTIKKMRTTSRTSISDTMITAGARRRLRAVKCMSTLRAGFGGRQRACREGPSLRRRSGGRANRRDRRAVILPVMFAQKLVAQTLHFDRKRFDLFAVV